MRYITILIFLTLLFCGIVYAQTVTPEQIQLLEDSVAQNEKQYTLDDTEINGDEQDIQSKQADEASLNSDINAAESFLSEVSNQD